KPHPDHPIAGHRVRNHLAVPRLEDVQRKEHVGKEHNVGQRKEGKQIGHANGASQKSEVGSLSGQASYFVLQTSDFVLQTSDFRLQTSDFVLRTFSESFSSS